MSSRFIDALMSAGDDCRINGRPLPFIETDIFTAMSLAESLAGDIGCRTNEISSFSPGGFLVMFDGVQILGVLAPDCSIYVG